MIDPFLDKKIRSFLQASLASQQRAEIDHIVKVRLSLEGCGNVAQQSNIASGHGLPGLLFVCRLAR